VETSLSSDWRLLFDVNVLGMAFVTKSFINLLRPQKGRIVNIASVCGRFAMRGTSAYCGTKYAVEGISDALRREVCTWGLKVIIIEPGVMRTPIFDVTFDEKQLDIVYNQLSEEIQELYGKEFFVQGREQSKELIDKLSNDPQMVVDTLEEALTTNFPLTRYSVGRDIPLWFFLTYAPTWLTDFLLKIDPKQPVPKALGPNKKKNNLSEDMRPYKLGPRSLDVESSK